MAVLQRPSVVSVDEVILHIVDPPGGNRRSEKEARKLRLSQTPLPPSSDQRVFSYFRGHIENALKDDNLRAARFVASAAEQVADEAAPSLRQTIDGLIDAPQSLVAASGILAKKLYDVMEPRGQISAGDLAVCLCQGRGGDGDWSRFVALLKIDSTVGFPQVERHEGGKTYVTVDVASEAVEVLPTTRQKLQKTALVRPRASGAVGYDMLLLDRQNRDQPGHVARFFVDDFLGAEVMPVGEIPQTQAVYREVVKERNASRAEMNRAQMQRHEERLAKLLKKKETSIDEVADVFTGASKRRLEAALRAELPAARVDLDTRYAERISRERKFHGEGNLTVKALARFWPKILHSERFVSNAAGGGYWEIVLHTETWEEVP